MNKSYYFLVMLVCTIVLSSCKLMIIPKAINTVNAVSLEELNLKRDDYKIMNTITAEAIVTYKQNSSNKITVQEKNGEFRFIYKYSKGVFGRNAGWKLDSFSGVARLGYLDNDYEKYETYVADAIKPEFMARAIASYRLINACKVAGGDGVIEPIISTSVEQSGANSVTYKTTISAKIIKLKTDSK